MRDIENRNDVKEMVEGFYTLVNKDTLLGPVFNEVAKVKWPDHLSLMVDFWSTLLFGTGEYKGQPFPRHATLPLTPAHFERWIEVFNKNIEARFEGPVSSRAQQQAGQIARLFAFKYQQINRQPH